MIGFLIPGVVIFVTFLKSRFDVLKYVIGGWVVNAIALIWKSGASDGEGLPFWLVLLGVVLWLGMLGSLMVEPNEESWWGRNRMDERFAVVFRILGIALLVAMPVALGIAYIFESNVGAVIVMAVFAAALLKAFVWDEMRA